MAETELPAVRVPASTSNLGAGFDCLGLALDVWLEASLAEGDGPPVYGGTLAGFDPTIDHIALSLGDTSPTGLHLEVHSSIPVSRGLGSSAAALVAGFALARLHRMQQLDRDALFELATKREGHPDNAGPAVYGGLVLYAMQPKRIEFHDTLGVAIAIPEQTISTHAARVVLPEQFSRHDTIQQASRCSALVLGLTRGDGDLIQMGMIDHIAVPARRSLIQGFEAAVEAGVAAGAFGVTISGAGAGIVAICEKEAATHVANAMADAITEVGNKAVALAPDIAEGGLEVLRGGENL